MLHHSMVHMGQEVRSQTDYILGTDQRLFRNVSAWDPRRNSDHYLIVGWLYSTTLRENSKYLGRHTRIPLRPPGNTNKEVSTLRGYFQGGAQAEGMGGKREHMYFGSYIEALRNNSICFTRPHKIPATPPPPGAPDQGKPPGRPTTTSTDDRGGYWYPFCLWTPPLVQEACLRMKGWYKEANEYAPLTTWITINHIKLERVSLYQRVPPPGNTIPVSVQPLAVDKYLPEEAEIEWAVKWLRPNRFGGPSGVRA